MMHGPGLMLNPKTTQPAMKKRCWQNPQLHWSAGAMNLPQEKPVAATIQIAQDTGSRWSCFWEFQGSPRAL
jgi:hypothetical protein